MFLNRGIQSDSGLIYQPVSHGVGACTRVHKHTHTFTRTHMHVYKPGVLSEKQAEDHR